MLIDESTNIVVDLFDACRTRNPIALRETLERDSAEINAVDVNGDSALHIAARDYNPQCLQILLKYEANVNAVNNYKWSALHTAASCYNYNGMKILLECGAKVNIKSDRGETPLRVASNNGEYTCIQLLLKYDADPTIADENGHTPLHMFVFGQKDPNSAELLVKALKKKGKKVPDDIKVRVEMIIGKPVDDII